MTENSGERMPESGPPHYSEPERRPSSSEPAFGEYAPPSKPSTSSTMIWAAVAVASMIIVAAVAVTLVIINHNSGKPSGTIALPSTLVPSSSPRPMAIPSTPAANTGQPDLTQFAREWRGMRESIVIDPAGHGHFHYMMACAGCSMAEMPYTTIDFTLTSVSNGTASGSVTASSDPQNPVGETVAAALGSHDTIEWSIGGKNVGLFCGSDPAWCGG